MSTTLSVINLPQDIWTCITGFLHVPDLMSVFLSCKDVQMKLSHHATVTHYHIYCLSRRIPYYHYSEDGFLQHRATHSLRNENPFDPLYALSAFPSTSCLPLSFCYMENSEKCIERAIRNITFFQLLTSFKLVIRHQSSVNNTCRKHCILKCLPKTLFDIEIDYSGSAICIAYGTNHCDFMNEIQDLGTPWHHWGFQIGKKCANFKELFPQLKSLIWRTSFSATDRENSGPELEHIQPFLENLPASLTQLSIPFLVTKSDESSNLPVFSNPSPSLQPQILPNLSSLQLSSFTYFSSSIVPSFHLFKSIVTLSIIESHFESDWIPLLPKTLRHFSIATLTFKLGITSASTVALSEQWPRLLSFSCSRPYHVSPIAFLTALPKSVTAFLYTEMDFNVIRELGSFLAECSRFLQNLRHLQLGLCTYTDIYTEPIEYNQHFRNINWSSTLTSLHLHQQAYSFSENDTLNLPPSITSLICPLSQFTAGAINILPKSLTAASFTYHPGPELLPKSSKRAVVTQKMAVAHCEQLLCDHFGRFLGKLFATRVSVGRALWSIHPTVTRIEGLFAPSNLSQIGMIEKLNCPLGKTTNLPQWASSIPAQVQSIVPCASIPICHRAMNATNILLLPETVIRISNVSIVPDQPSDYSSLVSPHNCYVKRISGLVPENCTVEQFFRTVYGFRPNLKFKRVTWHLCNCNWIWPVLRSLSHIKSIKSLLRVYGK